MGLFDKVRVLVGALIHKPFAPRPEKAELTGQAPARAGRVAGGQPAAGAEAGETERVADLISQQRQQDSRP